MSCWQTPSWTSLPRWRRSSSPMRATVSLKLPPFLDFALEFTGRPAFGGERVQEKVVEAIQQHHQNDQKPRYNGCVVPDEVRRV